MRGKRAHLCSSSGAAADMLAGSAQIEGSRCEVYRKSESSMPVCAIECFGKARLMDMCQLPQHDLHFLLSVGLLELKPNTLLNDHTKRLANVQMATLPCAPGKANCSEGFCNCAKGECTRWLSISLLLSLMHLTHRWRDAAAFVTRVGSAIARPEREFAETQK